MVSISTLRTIIFGPPGSRRRPTAYRQSNAGRSSFQPQVEALENRTCPSFALVTSRAALAGNDYVNWSTLGSLGADVPNPSTALSYGGKSIDISKRVSGPFRIMDESGVGVPGNWGGNFAPGDFLLWTNNQFNHKTNRMSLNFGSSAVIAGGAQIQLNNTRSTFVATIQALDAGGNSLASFTEAGTGTNAADNSTIFIGISSDTANIAQITFDISKSPQNLDDFAINQFDIKTGSLAGVPTAMKSSPVTTQPPQLAGVLLVPGQSQLAGQPKVSAAAEDAAILLVSPGAWTPSTAANVDVPGELSLPSNELTSPLVKILHRPLSLETLDRTFADFDGGLPQNASNFA
jgi:hypothetical protein